MAALAVGRGRRNKMAIIALGRARNIFFITGFILGISTDIRDRLYGNIDI